MAEERLKEAIDKRNLDKQQNEQAFLQVMRNLFYSCIRMTGKVPPADTVLKTAILMNQPGESAPQVINPNMSLEDAVKQTLEMEGFDEFSIVKEIDGHLDLEDIQFESNPSLLIDESVLNVLNYEISKKKGKDLYLVDTPYDRDTFIFTFGKHPKLNYAFSFISDLKQVYISKRAAVFSSLDKQEAAMNKANSEKASEYVWGKEEWVLRPIRTEFSVVSEHFIEKVAFAFKALKEVSKYNKAFPFDEEKKALEEAEKTYQDTKVKLQTQI